MSNKLLISTFIVMFLWGDIAGAVITILITDGGSDAVAEPVETGSLTGSFIDPNDEPYCLFCDAAIFRDQSHSCRKIVTAYCPCKKCCGKWSDGHFANGQEVSFPALAAPSNIPFGTRINVPGYGVAEVKDRGGAITGCRLDVYFNDHATAEAWDRQILTVEILK
ncbi:hypothetical protein LCGC14_1083920 [marine sediment metagenome]|uniref:3D domain-containing protein n=1 Tax=marine sediment metagenome TaxID=412755 RepID=A0A0F9PXQ5_9ZZZZ